MKIKKSPERMCISCRGMFNKKDLIRIVRTPDGEFLIDKTGKAQGRGCYVCNKPECIAKCIKAKLLNKTLKQEIDKEVYDKLKNDFDATEKD